MAQELHLEPGVCKVPTMVPWLLETSLQWKQAVSVFQLLVVNSDKLGLFHCFIRMSFS